MNKLTNDEKFNSLKRLSAFFESSTIYPKIDMINFDKGSTFESISLENHIKYAVAEIDRLRTENFQLRKINAFVPAHIMITAAEKAGFGARIMTSEPAPPRAAEEGEGG